MNGHSDAMPAPMENDNGATTLGSDDDDATVQMSATEEDSIAKLKQTIDAVHNALPSTSAALSNGHSVCAADEEPMDTSTVAVSGSFPPFPYHSSAGISTTVNPQQAAGLMRMYYSYMYPNGAAPTASGGHAYAGFSTPAQEPKPFIGPKLPDDYKEQKRKALAQQPPRVPSPVSTEARERLLQLQSIAAQDKPPAKLTGVGRLLVEIRDRERLNWLERSRPQASFWIPPSSQKPVPIPQQLEQMAVDLAEENEVGRADVVPMDAEISATTVAEIDKRPKEVTVATPKPPTAGSTLGGQAGRKTVTFVPYPEVLGPEDVPAAPPHPTDPDEIRKLIRTKMHRCKVCKNRFIEKYLLEAHLRKQHPDDYLIHMAEQEAEMDAQRREEMEQMRIEEIQCGGFIPPASEVEASNFDVDPEKIPLPGEGYGGIPATFDRYGSLKIPRRPYKKKISPQCCFCDKRFRNENSLKKHVAKKHPECIDFTQCNLCYKAIKTVDDLPNHLCELKWVCFECTPIRNLCTEHRLLNHRMKFHRGANSGFKCNECSRKFLTPRKLRKHKKMAHVVTKPYKCHFCDEYFPTEVQCALHERVHTGKVKFECNVCDFRANRWVRLDKHKREEHGYLCSICLEKMGEWAELKHHTLEKHSGYLTSERNVRCIESPRVWVIYKGE